MNCYQKRISRLQKKLRRKKIDALLVSQPDNRRYLSGFTAVDHGISESSGLLLIPAKGSIFLLTDSRYILQAKQDVSWIDALLYSKGVNHLLERLLPDLSIKKLGFESDYTLVSTACILKKTLTKLSIKLEATNNLIESMRLIKDETEIDLLRKSVRLNEQVFETVYQTIDKTKTELDIALAIEETILRFGGEGSSFDAIVASGTNSALPHAVPTTDKIKQNKSLTIDMGLILNGYCSDMTRNFVPNKPSKKYRKIHKLVRKAQLAGMSMVKAGVRACDVDKAARSVIKEAGFGKDFGHSLGHGVGLAVHEEPRVSSLNKKKLKAGMIITIEPGIYIPGWGGIRLENMLVVREDGYENLNINTTWLDI